MAEQMHNPAADTAIPPPGILIAGHYDESYGYRVHRTHGTRDWLITYTLQGEGLYRFGNRSYPCRPGDLSLLAPGTPHHYLTPDHSSRWEFVWAHFVPREHWLRWLQMPEIERGFVQLTIAEESRRSRIRSAFERLIVDSRSIGWLQEELALNALEEIILQIALANPASRAKSLDPRIEEVLDTMARRLTDPLHVAELADQVCLSPSRLAHLFKLETGDSIMETLQKMRLRQSARLLEFTSRRISEIAAEVGFSSPYYYSRQFSKYYGISPTLYRERVHQSEGT